MRRVYLEYMGDSVELPRGETIVGRDVGCALRFNDPSVSRRHLRFIRRADDLVVEDLRSSNGTMLNGRLVRSPQPVREGDVITVGGRSLTVRITDGEIELPRTLILDDLVEDPTEADRDPPDHAVISELARAHTSQIPRVSEPTMRTMPVTVPPVDQNSGGAEPRDRRRHDRIPIELRLIYLSSDLEIEATTRDLSQSGVFVCTQILEPVGTRCQLTILMDGGPALRVAGVVRRVVEHNTRGEPIGLGVELVDLGPDDRAWIEIAALRMTSG